MPRLVIQKGTPPGRDKALGGECVVGRHPLADFVLEDDQASRRHFRVFPQGGAWLLEDLKSTNGTFVNKRKVARQPLVDGDVIRAGATEIVFVQKDLLGDGSSPRSVRTRARTKGSSAAPSARGGVPVPRRHRR